MRGGGISVGVDVGGTFTDFTLVDSRVADVRPIVAFHKVPSTPDAPALAIALGLDELSKSLEFPLAAVEYLGHGTTVGTNALIELRGARTGLVTTAGFRDVLEIARQTRPHLYDYSVQRRTPIVPRRWRFEVEERMDAEGVVLMPLNASSVREVGRRLVEAKVEAVAVCFLHAYRNPAHERQAEGILRECLPATVPISLSSEVAPEFREFERTSTTAANAFLRPRMAAYLGDFLVRLEGMGITTRPFTFHSNGGLMSPDEVGRLPVRTCLSGPAAGVMGAAQVGDEAGTTDVITFDVGGTSTDVSLISGGRPSFSLERMVAGYPIKSPTLDVHVIGAGGGSIAWRDEGGALRVGPHSAGAVPGPLAYGKGGEQPTLTDANVVLARLNPRALLGGALPLDQSAAVEGFQLLGQAFGRSASRTALGVIQVACANIARAIRKVSTEQGLDVGQFTLMGFGGAGPLLAAEVAREVGCCRVLVPVAPGTMCARGILSSDLSTDYVRTVAVPADDDGWKAAKCCYKAMLEQADAWFELHGVAPEAQELRLSSDMRYLGQGFEIGVPLALQYSVDTVLGAFHEAHERYYGYQLSDRSAEIVNVRVQAVGKLERDVRVSGQANAEAQTERDVYFGKAGWISTPVVQRLHLTPGISLGGPVIVEELSSTTVVLPGDVLSVDNYGNLLLDVAIE